MGNPMVDIHISVPLTNFALRYMQEETSFIADKVLPPLPGKYLAGKYFTFDRGNWRERQDTLRAPGSAAARTTQPVISNQAYLVQQHSLVDVISNLERDQADAPLAPLQDATASIMEQLLISRERRVAATVFTTTAAANSTSLPAASKWDYTSTTTPIDDVQVGISAVRKEIGKKPNTGVMGQSVWDKLKNHAQVIERVKYTQLGFLNTDLVAQAMDLDNLLVGGSVYMTTGEGIASESVSYIWGKNFLVSYANPRPMVKSVSHGYLFTLADNGAVKVRQWPDEDVDGTKVEGSLFYDPKIVSTPAAFLIVDAVG